MSYIPESVTTRSTRLPSFSGVPRYNCHCAQGRSPASKTTFTVVNSDARSCSHILLYPGVFNDATG